MGESKPPRLAQLSIEAPRPCPDQPMMRAERTFESTSSHDIDLCVAALQTLLTQLGKENP